MSIFSNVAGKKVRASKFNLSEDLKTSFLMGQLVPTYMREVLPGDTFRGNTEIFCRFASMIFPVLHRVNIKTYWFFVPTRIIWNDWEDFITGGLKGDKLPLSPWFNINSTSYTNFGKNTLADYLGIPPLTAATDSIQVSSLPFRAYSQIYNDWFLDQNLGTEIDFTKESGSDPDITKHILRNKAWNKDYFTAATPTAQKGTAPSVPIDYQYKSISNIYNSAGVPLGPETPVGSGGSPDEDRLTGIGGPSNNVHARIENLDNNAGGMEIEDLRRTARLQEWLERTMRFGSRYIEQMLGHWNVRSSDARLQRAELLGSSSSPVVISEVLNTAGDPQTNTAAVGQMAGHGITASAGNGFKRSFEEHGYLMQLSCVLPTTAYQNGLERLWTRTDKFDYPWPEFAQLGEQEIKNREVYFDLASGSQNDGTWGYTPRYAEFKTGYSKVTGEMRDTLAYTHMARIFNSLPPLNEQFILSDPDKRIFAVEDAEQIYLQMYHSIDAIRKLPYHNIPSL